MTAAQPTGAKTTLTMTMTMTTTTGMPQVTLNNGVQDADHRLRRLPDPNAQMDRIAAMDADASLVFDHRDPAVVRQLSSVRIHD